MRFDSQQTRFFQRSSQTAPQPRGFLQKLALAVVTAAVFVVTLMFSVVVFAVVLAVGVVAAGYLWWKVRGVRKEMQRQAEQRRGTVIEGVVIREVDSRHDQGR